MMTSLERNAGSGESHLQVSAASWTLASKARSKELLGDFAFDERTQRYRDLETGRFVSREAVNRILDSVMGEAGKNVIELAQAMVAGEISPTIFGLEAAVHLKNAHLCATALAHGGWDRVTQADWGRLGRKLRDEFSLLRSWVEKLESGQAIADSRAVTRAAMYVYQTWGTYEQERRRAHMEVGFFQFERRVLHSRDPCVDCEDFASQGWVPIGTLPEIGDSACNGSCRCEFEYMIEEVREESGAGEESEG